MMIILLTIIIIIIIIIIMPIFARACKPSLFSIALLRSVDSPDSTGLGQNDLHARLSFS